MWNPLSITKSVSSFLNKSSTAKTMRSLAKSLEEKSEEIYIQHNITNRRRNYSTPAVPNRSRTPPNYQRQRSNSAYPIPVSTRGGLKYTLPSSNINSPRPLHRKYSVVSSSTSHIPRKYSMASTSSQHLQRKCSEDLDTSPHVSRKYSMASPSESPKRNPALSYIGRSKAIKYNHQIICQKRSDPIISPRPTYRQSEKRNTFRNHLTTTSSCPPVRRYLSNTRKSSSIDETYKSRFAHISPRPYSPSLPTDLSIFPGPINAMTLSLAIKKNIEKLNKLAEECACLNNLLCENVSQQRSIVAIINKQQMENNEKNKQITPEQVQYLTKLNSIANRDIHRACVAYVEYMDTITELNVALNMAEQDVEVRAGKLTLGSHFRKLDPDAVLRINLACNSSQEEEEETDNDDDIDLYSLDNYTL